MTDIFPELRKPNFYVTQEEFMTVVSFIVQPEE